MCDYMACFKKDEVTIEHEEEWTRDEFEKRLKNDLKSNDTRAHNMFVFCNYG